MSPTIKAMTAIPAPMASFQWGRFGNGKFMPTTIAKIVSPSEIAPNNLARSRAFSITAGMSSAWPRPFQRIKR
jgi:hypothetical protein